MSKPLYLRPKCPHGVRVTYCGVCLGAMICKICGRRRDRCGHHNGSEVCNLHRRRKENCSECHPDLNLLHKIRKHCRRVFKQNNVPKSEIVQSSKDTLGCTVEYFNNFLQKKIDWWNARFLPKMSLQTMQLDHIKPINELKKLLKILVQSFHGIQHMDATTRAQFEAAIKSIMHVTNLQPLPPCINAMKKDKWDEEDNAEWTSSISYNYDYEAIYLPKSVWALVKSCDGTETSGIETAQATQSVSCNIEAKAVVTQTKITHFFCIK